MGRRKLYEKRYLIGLDKYQAAQLEGIAKLGGLTYSEAVGMLLTLYQLGKVAPPSN